jgi:PAS domain S-box-containing protein
MENEMEFYSEKLILLRKKSGLTVKHITEQLDIGRSTYWNWENKMRTPSEQHTRELARLLNVNVSEISDLIEAVKVKENLLFGKDTNWEQLTNDRGKELANRQKIALNMIASTTEELNKVWSIVQGLMESLDTIMYIKDINSKYILANSAFRNNLGLLPSFSVSGKEDIDFYPKNEAKDVYNEDLHIIDTGETIHHKVSIIPGSRKKKWGLISKHPIYDYKGKVSGLVCSYDNITEIKKLQRFRALLEAGIKHSHDIFSIRKTGEKIIFMFLKQYQKDLVTLMINL